MALLAFKLPVLRNFKSFKVLNFYFCLRSSTAEVFGGGKAPAAGEIFTFDF
jgi:hypothetical protein